MTERNTGRRVVVQQLDNSLPIEIAADISAAKKHSDFVSRLHEFLDFYQLFDTFVVELRAAVWCDSIEYQDKATKTTLINGIAAKHQCDYSIKYEGLSLGNLRITRETELLDGELELIEKLLAGLTLPLRQALRYLQVIHFTQSDVNTALNNSDCHDVVELEIERSNHYKDPYTLLIFNLADFERMNISLGSQAGDAIVRQIATRIKQKACARDIVYGSSGDELLIFLSDTDKEEASVVAKKIKSLILTEAFEYEDTKISFSLKAGIVTVTHDETAARLIDRIDKTTLFDNISGTYPIDNQLSTECFHRLKKSLEKTPRQQDSYANHH